MVLADFASAVHRSSLEARRWVSGVRKSVSEVRILVSEVRRRVSVWMAAVEGRGRSGWGWGKLRELGARRHREEGSVEGDLGLRRPAQAQNVGDLKLLIQGELIFKYL